MLAMAQNRKCGIFCVNMRMLAGSPSSGSGSRGRSNEAATPELPAHVARCAELLAELPAELLARAAFRAGAHARALRGFEVHVRAKAGGCGGLNPAASRSAAFEHADVSFLQARPRVRAQWCAWFGQEQLSGLVWKWVMTNVRSTDQRLSESLQVL